MAINYLYFWDSCTFYATVQPAAEMHSQSTVSITLSLDGAFELEVQDEQGAPLRLMRELQAVFVPPGVSHRVTTRGVRRVVVTLEPGSSHYDAAGSILRQERPTAIPFRSCMLRWKDCAPIWLPPLRGGWIVSRPMQCFAGCLPQSSVNRRLLTRIRIPGRRGT